MVCACQDGQGTLKFATGTLFYLLGRFSTLLGRFPTTLQIAGTIFYRFTLPVGGACVHYNIHINHDDEKVPPPQNRGAEYLQVYSKINPDLSHHYQRSEEAEGVTRHQQSCECKHLHPHPQILRLRPTSRTCILRQPPTTTEDASQHSGPDI